jgi:hypothetical protein
MSTFLDLAAAELRLNEAEKALLMEAAIRSFDEFHSVLKNNPSLARMMADVRWDDLLRRLEPLLSERYRQRLDMPPREMTLGAGFELRVGIVGQPDDWPARDKPESLTDANDVDLLTLQERGWPPRDQGRGKPTCVGFAVAAAMERARRGTPAMDVQRLAPVFLYNRTVRSPGHPKFKGGGTRITLAHQTLGNTGICLHDIWPDDTDPATNPPQPVIMAASQMRDTTPQCWNLGRIVPRWSGPARAVYELLKQGRPVAISVPVFMDPATKVSAWQAGDAPFTGKVPEPLRSQKKARMGHAVCVLGFQKDPQERLGGWFIFRNSEGTEWAQEAPGDPSQRPFVPFPGYGAISAGYMHDHVVEIFAPR